MKSPSYNAYSSKLLGLAAITMTSSSSAFMPQSVTQTPLSTSLCASVAADPMFFPVGRTMGRGDNGATTTAGSTTTTSSQQQAQKTTPKPASSTHTNNMELIDQLKHDATVIFSIIDSDASGSISKEEFSSHLQQQPGSSLFSESFVDELFDRMDINGDGAISDSEFRTFYLTVPSLRALPGMGKTSQQEEQTTTKTTNTSTTTTTNPYETIMATGDRIFASLDTDGNGYVDLLQLKEYFTDLGKTFQDKAMEKIFNLLDEDGDLSLGREEFRDAYWRYSAFRKALGESL